MGWLTKWGNNRQLKTAREFVSNLREMDRDEIGILVSEVYQAGDMIASVLGADVWKPAVCVYSNPKISILIGYLIQELQKKRLPEKAAGTMVWLHSIRPFYIEALPEQRTVAREMWRELQRGFPFVESLGITCEKFPEGLTPDPI